MLAISWAERTPFVVLPVGQRGGLAWAAEHPAPLREGGVGESRLGKALSRKDLSSTFHQQPLLFAAYSP